MSRAPIASGLALTWAIIRAINSIPIILDMLPF